MTITILLILSQQHRSCVHVDVIDCVSGSLNVGEVLQHSCMMLAELKSGFDYTQFAFCGEVRTARGVEVR